MKHVQGLIIGLALSITAAPAMAGGQEATPPPAAVTPAPPVPPEPASPLASDEGRVVLNCEVQRDGGFTDCQIEEEEPAGYGFGPAALRVAAQSRLAPDSTRPLGARARWTTRFRLDD